MLVPPMSLILVMVLFTWAISAFASAESSPNHSTSFIIAGCPAGLSNRLRLLAGYMWVAKQKYDDCLVVMVWDITNECPGHFLEVFLPLDNVIFITSHALPFFQNSTGLLKDYGMSSLDFRGVVLDQNDVPMNFQVQDPDSNKRHHVHGTGLEAYVFSQFRMKKHVLDEALVFVKKNNICAAQATHMRMTDSSANLNTWQYWQYMNNTAAKTFLMTDNPLAQAYFQSEFPEKVLVLRPISQLVAVNPVLDDESAKKKAGPFNIQFEWMKLAMNASRHTDFSHVAMTEEQREQLPPSYRYTTLAHTMQDVIVAAHARDFKPSMYSSLSDVVMLYRPRARKKCDDGFFEKVKVD